MDKIDEGIVALLACHPFVSAFYITSGKMTDADQLALREVIDDLSQSFSPVMPDLAIVINLNYDGLYNELHSTEMSYKEDLLQIHDEAIALLPKELRQQFKTDFYLVAWEFYKKIDENRSSLEKRLALDEILEMLNAI